MAEDTEKRQAQAEAELEREIRSRRKFSLADAIGREGAELMKGASPVTHKRQAELEVEQYLEEHLEDQEGALQVVLLRHVRESESLLEKSYSDSLAALAWMTEWILDSATRLRRFVNAVDAEWGRIYTERPHFERDGSPPHREDPYTLSSVRGTLERLLEDLGRERDVG